jgi:hypothetical protein
VLKKVLERFVPTPYYKQVARARQTRRRTVHGQLETSMQKLDYPSRSDRLALAIAAWQAQNNLRHIHDEYEPPSSNRGPNVIGNQSAKSRLPFRYSLRALFIAVTLAAVGFAATRAGIAQA